MKMYEYPKEGDLQEVKIELTKNCPLSCIHCSSNAHSRNVVQLPREAVLSIVEQAAEMGVRSVVFSGGEPLSWPWLHEAVSSCASNGLQCSIYTTGITPALDGARQILSLAEVGLNRAVFSLYSSSQQRHEEITRTVNSFDNTVTAMRSLAKSDVEREIHFVPLKRNFAELPRLAELARDAGISKMSILRFVPQGRGVILKKSSEMLMCKETQELRDSILACRRQPGLDIRLGSPYNILLLEHDVDCVAARTTMCIGPNGNIYPCDAFKNIEPHDIGVNDQYNNVLLRSLQECWEKSKYLDAIRRYLTTPFGEPCSSCGHLGLCKSGCLAQKVLEQESMEAGNIMKKSDPLCLRSMIGGQNASY